MIENSDQIFEYVIRERLNKYPHFTNLMNGSYKFVIIKETKQDTWYVHLSPPQPAVTRSGGSARCTIILKERHLLDLVNLKISFFDLFKKKLLQIEGDREMARHLWLLLWDTVPGQDRQYYLKEAAEGFDTKYGTDTSNILENHQIIGMDPESFRHNSRYKATPVTTVKKAIESLKIKFADFLFIDAGCGKGRVLLVAAAYPFKRVIGIEYIKELSDIAKKNITIFPQDETRCPDINVVRTDIRDFEIPVENMVIFFYEPFSIPFMEEFLCNLKNSIIVPKQKLYIIYAGQLHLQCLSKCSWLFKIGEIPSPFDLDSHITFFSNNPD